eukprot:GHVT01063871.1.p1 GENE.GHVT01063871.1~~GHVT01063871.1.p1  ORF type:complete len:222 (+),score=6.42 GHVT01063871.1:227-892(+)
MGTTSNMAFAMASTSVLETASENLDMQFQFLRSSAPRLCPMPLPLYPLRMHIVLRNSAVEKSVSSEKKQPVFILRDEGLCRALSFALSDNPTLRCHSEAGRVRMIGDEVEAWCQTGIPLPENTSVGAEDAGPLCDYCQQCLWQTRKPTCNEDGSPCLTTRRISKKGKVDMPELECWLWATGEPRAVQRSFTIGQLKVKITFASASMPQMLLWGLTYPTAGS